MDGWPVELLNLRIFFVCIGLVGNVFLILSIIQNMFSRVKSFEVFLLGLAVANLEGILIMNLYDIVMLDTWLCCSLRFLTVFGEITSILFTVLISIFRYQKLRDADKRVNFPIFLDSIRSAWMVSGLCVMVSALLSLPIYAISLEGPAENFTSSTRCPPDFFQCNEGFCPIFNLTYKYLFIVVCNLLPLILVTVTCCLIITVLLSQRKTVTPAVSVSGSSQFGRKNKDPRLKQSTIAVLAAMVMFQVDWILYPTFLLTLSPTEYPYWDEVEFFSSSSYTTFSPYVYGIGSNLFSLKNCIKK